MTELLDYLRDTIDNLGDVTITEDHMQMILKKRSELKQGKRNDWKFAMDVDCLMLEEFLINIGKVKAPLLEHHTKGGACVYDCIVELPNTTAFVDFKCIDKNNDFNLDSGKFIKREDGTSWETWVRDGIVKGLLTDYCFYRMYRPEQRPLCIGDVVQFELINVLNSRFVIKSLNDSVRDPGGKFYRVEKYV